MKKAICIGINDYGGNADLRGCVNDCEDWTKYFALNDFEVLQITDSAAFKENVINSIQQTIKGLGSKDTLAITYSGHGTQVRDTNGDEKDGNDEALAMYDYLEGGLIFDDELASIFSKSKAQIIMISDSCHSGTVHRATAFGDAEHNNSLARFLRMPKEVKVANPPSSNSDSNTILFSGCRDDQYSLDAYIDGRFRGAFTAAMLGILENEKVKNYNELYRKLKKVLPSSLYAQNPQYQRPTRFMYDAGKKPLWT